VSCLILFAASTLAEQKRGVNLGVRHLRDATLCFYSKRDTEDKCSLCWWRWREDSFKFTIVAKRSNLTDEEDRLLDTLPPANSFIILPFVTRLTHSNIVNNNMVCFSNLVMISSIVCVGLLTTFLYIFCIHDGILEITPSIPKCKAPKI
jgi:hypothetical protein